MKLLIFLFAMSPIFAADRSTIEPIGFSEKSIFVYRANDPACICKKEACFFEDEAGNQPCVQQKLISIDLTNDKMVSIDQKALTGLKLVGAPPKAGKFPLNLDGDSFSVSLGEDCNKDYESVPPKTSTLNCEVFLISKNRGTKKISSLSYDPSPNHSVTVISYFKHPSESKIGIILSEGYYHFEGESYYYQRVVGADLTKGFKK